MTLAHGKFPLRALQVFEAAARLGSFTAAGAELGITQSAVSRQVSDLETGLGARLFLRNGARLSVTPAGARLAGRLGPALAEIRAAVADAQRSDRVVTLSMLPSVAARWFAPRLGDFMAQNPGLDMRLSASRHLVDFAAEGVDAAIRYAPAPPPGLEATLLGTETVTPVCAPGYAAAIGLQAPADLARATLLCGDIPEDWPAWFRAAGCTLSPPRGPKLGDDGAILQAAAEGQGVALGRSLLVADDLATGRLVAPFGVTLPASFAYWFVHPTGAAQTEAISAVRDWVRVQFKSDA